MLQTSIERSIFEVTIVVVVFYAEFSVKCPFRFF